MDFQAVKLYLPPNNPESKKNMKPPHKLWIEQVEAAEAIRDEYGLEKSLGYLVGEKFLKHLEYSEKDEEFKTEIELFIQAIKDRFEPWELRQYLDSVQRVGTLGHTMTDENYKEIMESGLFDDGETPISRAEDLLRLSQAMDLLL
jgi:aminopeptidase N